MKLTSNKGFSLVELMIVLAIISVIALISIPNLTKNVAKAKQKNAQVELSGIFTQEESFRAEYNQYHDNLPLIGFVPSGIELDEKNCPKASAAGKSPDRYYAVGFAAAALASFAAVSVTCTGAGAWVSYYPTVLQGSVNSDNTPAAAQLN